MCIYIYAFIYIYIHFFKKETRKSLGLVGGAECRDARPEYVRSSDFRFGNSTLIPLSLASRILSASGVSLLLHIYFFFLFIPHSIYCSPSVVLEARARADAGRYTGRYTGTGSVRIHMQTTGTHSRYTIWTHTRTNVRKKLSDLPQATALARLSELRSCRAREGKEGDVFCFFAKSKRSGTSRGQFQSR